MHSKQILSMRSTEVCIRPYVKPCIVAIKAQHTLSIMYSCKRLKIAVNGCAVVLAKHLTERRSMSILEDSTVQGTTVLEKLVLSFYWFP